MTDDSTTAIRPWTWKPSARTVLLGVTYVTLYLLLDWASYVEPLHHTSVTPWNPNTGVSLALLLWGGSRWAPLVALSIFVGETLTDEAPVPWDVLVLTSLYIAAVYAAAAGWLRRRALGPPIVTARGATWFAAVTAVATGVAAFGYTGILTAAGQMGAEEFWASVGRCWVGDFNGIIALVPVLLVTVNWRALPHEMRRRRHELSLQALGIVVGVALAFALAALRDVRLFYPLLVPVAWISLRNGVPGGMISVSLIQAALVAALKLTPGPISVFDLQFPLVSLGITALFLGALATQRDTALRQVREQEATLQRSIRFAAAGELATALTHELNQPMTALLSYVRAAELLAGTLANADARLASTLHKAGEEAMRATAVLRRLREFYRGEGPRLEATDAVAVCSRAAQALQDRMRRSAVEFQLRRDENLPSVVTDRTQLEIVVYNLVTNSLDAFDAQPAHPGRPRKIELTATAAAEHVLVCVEDSGPGVSAALAGRLFEPFVTDKMSGMGLGLALSRSLLRHQGADLWFEPGRLGGARFVMRLPTAATTQQTV